MLSLARTNAPVEQPLSAEKRSLAQAFASFTKAAGSLEHSYLQGQDEVARLRQELEQAHSDLLAQRETSRRLEALAEASNLLAHEIRNPLASLELFAGLLVEAGLGAEQLGWVRHIQAGVRSLSATVDNVLQLHHGSAPQLCRLELVAWLSECGEFVKPLAMQAGVELEVHSTGNPVAVLADQHGLQQVFLNLVLNALRSTPEGGQVDCSVSPATVNESPAVQIAISDTGCGITPENIEKIFAPGFTTRPGSAGLGLAVCRKIIEQHGGTISVTSALGEGATFLITLPAAWVES